ncbi:MAG: hypothetical protein HRU49_03780 [Winogradskyella sp.]|uniref:hypothetical protein n=1 Tax=Winogradskyella sp. TaxID=1883156 RepID=UPI0025F71DA7|nr:hypothetical protein [Winogradskyella sp.]NRB82882.1 hypothetical protein [Winogradskyella sp.]
MSNSIQELSVRKVAYPIAQSQVMVDDIFIDGISLQKTLKTDYNELFAKGRFKESFILYLGRTLSDLYHSKDKFLQSPLPIEGQTHISPLYGCADSCCVYLYVKVTRQQSIVHWKQIGRNTAFLNASSDTNIEWLTKFEPLKFNLTNYKTIIQILN